MGWSTLKISVKTQISFNISYGQCRTSLVHSNRLTRERVEEVPTSGAPPPSTCFSLQCCFASCWCCTAARARPSCTRTARAARASSSSASWTASSRTTPRASARARAAAPFSVAPRAFGIGTPGRSSGAKSSRAKVEGHKKEGGTKRSPEAERDVFVWESVCGAAVWSPRR